MNAASWLEALPPQERWRALVLSEGPRIATWGLALALGVQAAVIVTDLAGGGHQSAPPAASVRSHPLDVAAITTAHLFGSAPVAPQDGRDAGPSSVPLVLTGTIAGSCGCWSVTASRTAPSVFSLRRWLYFRPR